MAGDLRRISAEGKVTTVATRLSARNLPPANVSQRNYHMGLWTNKEGRVYVAVAMERLVLHVREDGRAEVPARSGAPWSPSGGIFAGDGSLWLLEYNSANSVRARHVGLDGKEQIFPAL